MKRYLSGIIAVVIALSAAAFTMPAKENKSLDSFTFYYLPPAANDYSINSVQDESNWKTAPSPMPQCGSTANKACSIVVDGNNTTGSGATRELDFELHAVAGAGGSGSGYVPQLSTTPEITSKVDKQ